MLESNKDSKDSGICINRTKESFVPSNISSQSLCYSVKPVRSFYHMFQLSRFPWAAAVLLFISEISCLEMILAWMSDIYESSKLITLSINLMSKAWLLVTKLGACVLAIIFIMSNRSVSIKGLIVLALAKKAPIRSLKPIVCNF